MTGRAGEPALKRGGPSIRRKKALQQES